LAKGKRLCAALSIAVLFAPAPLLADEPTAPGDLIVHFAGLRSTKGMIRACLTRNPALFLTCDKDPAALKANVPAGKDAQMEFPAVPPGDYVLAVVHDENGNDKVDTFMGIPREGVGFSRNPAMSFGPPKYEAARFHVASGVNATDVKLKYFL
jgi:uncharacterized protein (DUF2141 family)